MANENAEYFDPICEEPDLRRERTRVFAEQRGDRSPAERVNAPRSCERSSDNRWEVSPVCKSLVNLAPFSGVQLATIVALYQHDYIEVAAHSSHTGPRRWRRIDFPYTVPSKLPVTFSRNVREQTASFENEIHAATARAYLLHGL